MADSNEPVFEDDKDALRCRFYENQYPEPEEVVMCNVTEIGEMGAYVTLLEYDHVEVTVIAIERWLANFMIVLEAKDINDHLEIFL